MSDTAGKVSNLVAGVGVPGVVADAGDGDAGHIYLFGVHHLISRDQGVGLEYF